MNFLSFWSSVERLLLRKMDALRESLANIPYFCHQWEERSFSYKGHFLPVCARCTGVYLGQCVAVSFSFWLWTQSVSLYILFTFLMPMTIDWSAQEFLGLESNNLRRLITGFIGGFGFYSMSIVILGKGYQYFFSI